MANLRRHEYMGLMLIFLSGTLIGLGLYITIWGAVRPLYYDNLDYLIQGKELLLFPLFYGLGFVLWSLGKIELKEAMPGKKH
jgi:hypothetical protein